LGDEPLKPLNPEIMLSECRVTTFLSSGPGGQRRDRKRTAVRLEHLPTGIVTVASRRRSKAQNLEDAIERLIEKIEERRRVRKPRVPTRIPGRVKEAIRDEKRQRAARKRLRRMASRHAVEE